MKIERRGSAIWQGGLRDGTGTLSTESGVLEGRPYGYGTRFEGTRGTNPEELIAAAHAGCFVMALSMILSQEALRAERLATQATVTLEQVEGGFAITRVHLKLEASVPGADQATFEALAQKAKAGCPVSKLLNADISLETRLVT